MILRSKNLHLLVLAIVAIAGTVAGMGSYSFYYANGLSYLSDDPRSCVNCHIMREQFDDWQKGSHHAQATCNDCHVPKAFVPKYLTKIEHGYRHSKGFTLQDFHEPILIKPSSNRIVEDNCVRCHEELVTEITAHENTGEAIGCVHCHSHIGHGATR